MAIIVCTECGKEFSNKAPACPECGCPTAAIQTALATEWKEPVVVSQDRFPRDAVVKHLSCAKALEQTLYMYRRLFDILERKMQALGHRHKISHPGSVGYEFAFVWAILAPIFFVALLLCCQIFGNSAWDIVLILCIFPLFFGSEYLLVALGIAVISTIVITILICIIYAMCKKSAHNKEMAEYKQKVAADEARVARELKERQKLLDQQQIVQNEINKNERLLGKVYGLNVIYPAYRNMVAVTMIYEYFDSGRCDCLTGPHGAYDTYSYEEKMGKIIGKLDVIISKLDEIRNTQYMLYEAIQESISLAEQIGYQAESIAKSNKDIAENTKLIAYNTERTAFNTSVSAYVDTFY